MPKDITKFFSPFFIITLVLSFSVACSMPVGATERDKQDGGQLRQRKNFIHYSDRGDQNPSKKNNRKKYLEKKNDRSEIKDQLPVRNQLEKFIYDLSEKKDQLQRTYTYLACSTAHVGYSFFYSPEDVLYRCLHVALNVAPYITPYLPSGMQPHFRWGINGAGFLLEGMRALVQTKQWTWEQILGYGSLYFMRALPERALSEEMQGGLYFFFKTAGFYHVNFSLPYLPDSLWEHLVCYHTPCHAAAEGGLNSPLEEKAFNTNFIMTKTKKQEIYNDLDVSFHAAEFCIPDVQDRLAQLGLTSSYQKQIDTCNFIVNGWENLKPKYFGNYSFSIDPSSEVLIVNQRYYAVAHGDDFKHVLITASLMKCVGLALYNPETNTCGLAHVDGENIRGLDAYLEGKFKPKDNIDDFYRFFLDVAGKTPLSKIRGTLVSGFSPHINYLKRYMEIAGIKDIEIVHNPEWGKEGNAYKVLSIDSQGNSREIEVPKGSIAINCQNGGISNVANEPKIGEQMGMPPKIDNKPHPLTKVNGKTTQRK